MLYRAILRTARVEVGDVLDIVTDSAVKGEPVVFHCAKGKDRTGLISMWLGRVCGQDEAAVVESYAASAELLGGDDKPTEEARAGYVDWNLLRG